MSDIESWLRRAAAELEGPTSPVAFRVEVLSIGQRRLPWSRRCVFVGTSGQQGTPQADTRRHWPVSVRSRRATSRGGGSPT